MRKGAAFIFGWLLSLAAVVALTVLFTGNKPPKPNTAPSLAAIAVKILIGVVLVFIALRRRARMGQPKKPKKPPKWQTGIDNMSPWVVHRPGPAHPALGAGGRRGGHHHGGQAQLGGELHRPVPVLRGGDAGLPGHGDLRRLPARAGPDHPAGIRDVDRHPHRPGHHHPVSLGLGLWLVGKSIYSLVS